MAVHRILAMPGAAAWDLMLKIASVFDALAQENVAGPNRGLMLGIVLPGRAVDDHDSKT